MAQKFKKVIIRKIELNNIIRLLHLAGAVGCNEDALLRGTAAHDTSEE